jgi:hypothetical protein
MRASDKTISEEIVFLEKHHFDSANLLHAHFIPLFFAHCLVLFSFTFGSVVLAVSHPLIIEEKQKKELTI